MKKRADIIVSGKVQGVFYRASAKVKAEELNLAGWVKNISDGRVEILAEGDEKDLKEFIKWCYNGSSGAQVEKVETVWSEFKGRFDKFVVLM